MAGRIPLVRANGGTATAWRRAAVWIAIMAALIAVLAGLQLCSALATRDVVISAIQEPVGRQDAEVRLEKDRQDVIAARILNNSKKVLGVSLPALASAALGLGISVVSVLVAVFSYLDGKEKDRLERVDASNKEREDRLSAMLSETLTRLVADVPRQRVVGAAGLLPFFDPSRADFHLQALAALIAAARLDAEDAEVRQGLRLALEQAARNVGPGVLRKLSWQGVGAPRIDLRGCDLTGLDLRDVNFQDARLEGAKLMLSDLTAAKLQGAQLRDADLTGAVLSYADLAGASLAGAKLAAARLDGVKVLNLDLEGADFRSAGVGWDGAPWEATRNWRRAVFDPEARAVLDARYGEEAPEIKVFMLMWEAPPFIAGGTWTACYHLVRRLRERGLQLTVIVPWRRSALDADLFGVDVPVVSMEIDPPDDAGSPYASAPSWSPYGYDPYRSRYDAGPYQSGYGSSPSWSPYGADPYRSRYGSAEPTWSPYGPAYRPGGFPGAYGSAAGYGGGLSGSVLYNLIGEFRRRVQAYSFEAMPDVIHAHDWVTFEAARGLAERWSRPWVAHFHSIEADRQPDGEDPLTRAIEQMAVDTAQRVVAPSALTRGRLAEAYGHGSAEIAPNVLSSELADTADMGRFETRRVVFLGRVSRQKGLDRFAALAEAVAREAPGMTFEAFGAGGRPSLLYGSNIGWRGPLPWARRGEAFRGASLLVVPSVHEPFGMVVLEGMQHRTPVIYPRDSGAAEVLDSGIKVDPADIREMTSQVLALLGDLGRWEAVVRRQAEDIQAYPAKAFESRLIAVWRQLAAEAEARTA